MRTSQYLLFTLKEDPSEAKMVSHRLMIRSGMIRLLSSGLYTWLPTGLLVLRKMENIIRKEMEKIKAMEVVTPIIQPSYLWLESQRWTKYGPELFRIKDHKNRDFLLSPTDEEVITDMVRNETISYRNLPLIFYQIKTKFRDEIRPRFGVIRSREFLMKDGYSFHINQKSLQKTYFEICEIYSAIFSKIKLCFQIIEADTGSIGGNISHEFRLVDNFQNLDFSFSDVSVSKDDDKKNRGLFNLLKKDADYSMSSIYEDLKMVTLQDKCVRNLYELIKKNNFPIEKTIRIFVVHASKHVRHNLIALIIRGDHKLDKDKAEKLYQVLSPLTFAKEEEIKDEIGINSGWLGPMNLPFPSIIDLDVVKMINFISGANRNNQYFFGVNWKRDLPVPKVEDLRIREKNTKGFRKKKSPEDRTYSSHLEIAHIFQLGTKYSKKILAFVKGRDGRDRILKMGCYGIGITRVIAAVIEQNHDNNGIIWPLELAPFHVGIVPINMIKSPLVKEKTEEIYYSLKKNRIEVLLDDRSESFGKMCTDIELIGIPHILIIGEKNLKNGKIEYKDRSKKDRILVSFTEIIPFLVEKLKRNIF